MHENERGLPGVGIQFLREPGKLLLAQLMVGRTISDPNATDGDPAMMITMLNDFADLWERAAADGTPISEIVGDDPVEFAEAFAAAYAGKRWIDKERTRLTDTIRGLSGKDARS